MDRPTQEPSCERFPESKSNVMGAVRGQQVDLLISPLASHQIEGIEEGAMVAMRPVSSVIASNP